MENTESTALVVTATLEKVKIADGINIEAVEYDGERVLTSKQLADLYGTTEKIISQNFITYSEKEFIRGIHYYVLGVLPEEKEKISDAEAEEKRRILAEYREKLGLPKQVNKIYLWTEKGAYQHAQHIKNDVARNINAKLVEKYFKIKDHTLIALNEFFNNIMGRMNALDEKISAVSAENKRLQMRMGIDSEQQRQLQEIVKKKALESVNGDTEKYRKAAPVFNAQIWAVFRRKFHIDSYRNTPQYLFDEAVAFLENWQPSGIRGKS